LSYFDINNLLCYALGLNVRQITEGMKIRRKILLTIGQSLLIIALVLPSIANAASLSSKREEAQRVKNQVDSLSKSLNQITANYNSATTKLENISASLAKNEAELAVTQKELEKDQAIMNDRVKNIYRCGNVQFLEVVLGSKNVLEFLVRTDLLTKIGNQDSALLEQIKEKKQKIEETREQLAAQKEEQQKVVAQLKNEQKQMEANFAKQKSLLAGVEGEVSKLEAEEKASQQRKLLASRSGSSSSRSISINGFVFPCGNPHSFSNDWGAPRVGHRHQGCDIMAPKGTPAIACVSGTVRTSEGGRQGHAIWLNGDDGNSYFYAHLSGYAVTGGHVSAGQTIGYVGNTGNASGGACHIHFEIHPGGGGAINPYPILKAAD